MEVCVWGFGWGGVISFKSSGRNGRNDIVSKDLVQYHSLLLRLFACDHRNSGIYVNKEP